MEDQATTAQATETSATTTASAPDEWTIDTSDIVDDEANAEQPEDTETTAKSDEADQPKEDADTKESEPPDDAKADKKESEEPTGPEMFPRALKHFDEVKNVSMDEAAELAQKGMDYDRVRDKYDEFQKLGTIEQISGDRSKLEFFGEIAKQSGFRDVDDLIDNVQAKQLAEHEGIDETVAMQRVHLDRKERELKEKEAKLSAEKSAETSKAEAEKRIDEKRKSDFSEFFESEYGQLKPEDICKEVWNIYGDGTKGYSLVQSMQKYENSQLKAKLEAMKKSEENKVRSTGSAATPGTQREKEDPFVTGWNSVQ